MLSRDDCDPLRWQEERVLRPQLRGRLHDGCEAVAELRKKVGARQLVRGHQPAGAAPSGTRGRHTPVLAHQLASARKRGTRTAREIRGVPMGSTPVTKRRNVKSGSAVATDAHERRKDFLNET